MPGVKITLVICNIGISYIFVNNKAKIQRCDTCVSLDFKYDLEKVVTTSSGGQI